MKQLLYIALLLIASCRPCFATNTGTEDSIPNVADKNSGLTTTIINNNMRVQQGVLDTIGGYFNSNNILSPAAGGTGINLATLPNGSLLIYDATNVGIGTFGQGTSGQVLTSNGVSAFPYWGGHGIQVFTASGTFTAPTGITTIFLSMCGAGAGGGGGKSNTRGGGGGSAGECTENYPYTVVAGSSYTVTLNAAGTGGGDGVDGVDGGTTVFDALTMHGGRKGSSAAASTGGTGYSPDGGVAVLTAGGTVNSYTKTGDGGAGVNSNNGGGGAGGGTSFGLGGAGGEATVPSTGANSTGYGSGGGGGGGKTGTGASGGNGSKGIVIVQY